MKLLPLHYDCIEVTRLKNYFTIDSTIILGLHGDITTTLGLHGVITKSISYTQKTI